MNHSDHHPATYDRHRPFQYPPDISRQPPASFLIEQELATLRKALKDRDDEIERLIRSIVSLRKRLNSIAVYANS